VPTLLTAIHGVNKSGVSVLVAAVLASGCPGCPLLSGWYGCKNVLWMASQWCVKETFLRLTFSVHH
jgi:hypothetical protein